MEILRSGFCVLLLLMLFWLSVVSSETSEIPGRKYVARGFGGGGAMDGFSISPFDADLWFIGTDMGTLFRSYNAGETWQAVDHLQAQFYSLLGYSHTSTLGFCGDENTVIHVYGGFYPLISADKGITFSEYDSSDLELDADELVKYFIPDTTGGNTCLMITSVRVWRSTDGGLSWSKNSAGLPQAQGKGSFWDHTAGVIFHALPQGIYESSDDGVSWSLFEDTSSSNILAFSGGRTTGRTMAYVDSDSSYGDCVVESSSMDLCGRVWVKINSGSFTGTSQIGGVHLTMAENDDQTIYVAGSREWERQYGTKIFRSQNAGGSWELVFHQYDWDVVPYMPWPENKLEYSGVGLDVGWYDDASLVNSSIIGGSENFFFHVSYDGGDTWKSPFTKFADVLPREENKKWESTGLEVTSCYSCRYHPASIETIYCGFADDGGIRSDDNGKTWKFIQEPWMNSIYDFAFDETDENTVYAAMSTLHDFPYEWHSMVLTDTEGGIYKSTNKGNTWERLTPSDGDDMEIGYVALAYDNDRNILYGGTHGRGIVASYDGGVTWEWLNDGIYEGGRVIYQIDINPCTGDVYALLGHDRDGNRDYCGIYYKPVDSKQWTLLRGNVHYPSEADEGYEMWTKVVGFAIDWRNPEEMFLVDQEFDGMWLCSGIWFSSDNGANWNRQMQFTHPLKVKIDPRDSAKVHVIGIDHTDGEWGLGGIYYSEDKGLNWQKNSDVFLRTNGHNILFDKNEGSNLFYTFFGGGILEGENPIGAQGSLPTRAEFCNSDMWVIIFVASVGGSTAVFLFVVVAVVLVIVAFCCCRKKSSDSDSDLELSKT